jgi:16S rRNA (cytosine1402-N4)-methyltransferase
MRFDPSSGEPAWEWLSRVDEKTLADTIFRYGEERFSRRIAKRIVENRKAQPIRKASELRELIYRSVPGGRHTGGGRKHGRVDPATRTFQALRIAVNDELSILELALQRLPDCLAPGGQLLIISFHSLEDRLVKYAFREDERLEVVTRRPVQATEEEIARNPRSRSAKLRVARRR